MMSLRMHLMSNNAFGPAFAISVMALLAVPTRLAAGELLPRKGGFYGTWASDAHCRWPDEFMLVYEGKAVGLPPRSSGEPSLDCRILSVTGKRPEWKLRLSCRTWGNPELGEKRFEVEQSLKQSADGYEMIVETGPFLGYPARREEARYCRAANEPPPPLICFDEKKGHTVPCEP